MGARNASTPQIQKLHNKTRPEVFKWNEAVEKLEKLTGTTWSKTQLRLEELEKAISSAKDPVVALLLCTQAIYAPRGITQNSFILQ